MCFWEVILCFYFIFFILWFLILTSCLSLLRHQPCLLRFPSRMRRPSLPDVSPRQDISVTRFISHYKSDSKHQWPETPNTDSRQGCVSVSEMKGMLGPERSERKYQKPLLAKQEFVWIMMSKGWDSISPLRRYIYPFISQTHTHKAAYTHPASRLGW